VKLYSVSRQAHAEEFHGGRSREPHSHEMAVQLSRGVHPEMSPKDAVQAAETQSGGGVPRAGSAEGEPQKESGIEEGHLMPNHVYMMTSIPPKYAVSQVAG
jgi:hypothetical protein